MVLERIQAYRILMPLTTTYKVSFIEITHLELVLVIMHANGTSAFGETVAGEFFWEPGQDPWTFVQEWGPRLVGMAPEAAYAALLPAQQENPRAVQPLLTALEQLQGCAILAPPRESVTAPLVGTVLTFDQSAVANEVENLIHEGFGTLKVKVGFAVEADIQRTHLIQKQVAGRAQLRFDANMAYTFADAVRFATSVDPQGVQLFEQPFPPEAWDLSETLVKQSPLPLMLDESIYSEEDIRRAAQIGAQYVKFKLIKAGSMQRLLKWVLLAFDVGLDVVIGNGAGADPSCFHETLIVSQHLQTAGENNGFLKCQVPLLSEPLLLTRGAVHIPAGYDPRLNMQVVRDLSVAEIDLT